MDVIIYNNAIVSPGTGVYDENDIYVKYSGQRKYGQTKYNVNSSYNLD